MTFDELKQLATAMRSAGASVESVLLAMRSEGASQGTSLRVLRETEGGTIGAWKEVVDTSPTWVDRSAPNAEWRRRLLESLAELDEGEQQSDG